MDKDFQTFYLDLVKLLDLEKETVEHRAKIIDRVMEFRLEAINHVNNAYNKGLVEGGYAMNQIRNDYEHKRASP